MWESLQDYIASIGVWAWLALVCVEGIIGIAERVVKNATLPWKWFHITVAVLFLVVAPFLAFHNQRIENEDVIDHLKAEIRDARLEALTPTEGFQPLSESRRVALMERLSELNDIEYALVNVWVLQGDQNRVLLGEEIRDLLVKSGFTVKLIPVISTSTAYPIRLVFPLGGDGPAQAFLYALNEIVKTQTILRTVDDGPDRTLSLWITGRPLFWSDGTVTLLR